MYFMNSEEIHVAGASEQGGEGKEVRVGGDRQITQGLEDLEEDFGFYLSEVGATENLTPSQPLLRSHTG